MQGRAASDGVGGSRNRRLLASFECGTERVGLAARSGSSQAGEGNQQANSLHGVAPEGEGSCRAQIVP
jgi:hypothetical protein